MRQLQLQETNQINGGGALTSIALLSVGSAITGGTLCVTNPIFAAQLIQNVKIFSLGAGICGTTVALALGSIYVAAVVEDVINSFYEEAPYASYPGYDIYAF